MDGEWRFSPDDTLEEDSTGINNNFVDVPQLPQSGLELLDSPGMPRGFPRDFEEAFSSSSSRK